MSTDLIERLAREAGINFTPAGPADRGIDTWFGDQYLPNGALARFAALVAEHCAYLAAQYDQPARNKVITEIGAAFPMPKE